MNNFITPHLRVMMAMASSKQLSVGRRMSRMNVRLGFSILCLLTTGGHAFSQSNSALPEAEKNVSTPGLTNTFDEALLPYALGDYKAAINIVRPLAEQGNAGAQYKIGVMYANGIGVVKDVEQATSWFLKSAEQGNDLAQYKVGVMYANGTGVTKDANQAVGWYSKSAEQGNASAQYNLGWMYANGTGVKKDVKQAVSWYRKSAEQGNAKALVSLGVMHANGTGVKKDLKQAAAFYSKAVELGDPIAKVYLARISGSTSEGTLSTSDLEPSIAVAAYNSVDYKAAINIVRPLAEQGNAGAQYKIGVMYANGIGVVKDVEQATSWFLKSAEQGNDLAQYKVGVMYANGTGVTKDANQAVGWYSKSAEQGNASAQYNLGWMYANGTGVKKDVNQAVSWYRKSAEQGNAKALGALGWMYANGTGVKKDLKQATAFYTKAAEQGDAEAQYNLGVNLAKGKGVKKDTEQATAWYRKSAEQGNVNAQKELEILNDKGSSPKATPLSGLFAGLPNVLGGSAPANDPAQSLTTLRARYVSAASDLLTAQSIVLLALGQKEDADRFAAEANNLSKGECNSSCMKRTVTVSEEAVAKSNEAMAKSDVITAEAKDILATAEPAFLRGTVSAAVLPLEFANWISNAKNKVQAVSANPLEIAAVGQLALEVPEVVEVATSLPELVSKWSKTASDFSAFAKKNGVDTKTLDKEAKKKF